MFQISQGVSPIKVPDILRYRLPYVYVMLAFLLILNFFTASQAVFSEKDWASVGTSQLLFILTVIAFLCVVAVDVRQKQKGPKIEETGKAFSLTFVVSASWLFIFLAIPNALLDPFENLLMVIYFTKSAAIEEVTFRYALPRLLNFEGYGYWFSQIISNLVFSLAHFFVWEFSLFTALLGLAFGFANVLAFSYGRSFLGVVWAHSLHNLALAGANWWFMGLITGVILLVAIVRRWK